MTENAQSNPLASYDLSGRVAVVTGAASGIGRCSAEFLAAAGAKLVLGDIDADGLAETLSRVQNASEGVTQITDVTDRTAIRSLVERASGEYGRLDILCNIAGAMSPGTIEDLTDEALEKGLSLNLRSVIWGCQAAIAAMKKNDTGGSIINVSSGAIDSPAPGIGLYALTKAAVAMLTKTLATEVGPYGIRVNALAPGATMTKFTTWRMHKPDGTLDQEAYDAFVERMKGRSPLGEVGAAEDQAHLILHLASDAARWTTGAIVRANGGQTFSW